MTTELLIGVIIGLVLGALASGAVAFFVLKPQTEAVIAKAENDADASRKSAEREAETILKSARGEAKATRRDADNTVKQRYADLARAEERIDGRQLSLDKQTKRIEDREQNLNKRQSRLDKRSRKLEHLENEHLEELQRVAAMTTDEAKQQLLAATEVEARQDMARIIREIEDKAKESAEDKARELISLAIQRVASDHVSSAATIMTTYGLWIIGMTYCPVK